MKRSKLNHHKYVDPGIIAKICCVLFGGTSGHKLFGDDIYCEELMVLFRSLKAEAIHSQQRILDDDDDGAADNDDMDRIKELKIQIEALVDHPLFSFDALIANVVTETVFFEDGIDHFQIYLTFAQHWRSHARSCFVIFKQLNVGAFTSDHGLEIAHSSGSRWW